MLVGVTLFSGCQTVSIDSVRDPDYDQTIGKLYVLIYEYRPEDPFFFRYLEQYFKEELEKREISSIVKIKPLKEKDESIYIKEINRFHPDAVLTIRDIDRTIATFFGTPMQSANISWDASLYNSEMNKRIWRATINTVAHEFTIKKTPGIILKRMEQDQLITSSTLN